jgi:hypothetical protein
MTSDFRLGAASLLERQKLLSLGLTLLGKLAALQLSALAFQLADKITATCSETTVLGGRRLERRRPNPEPDYWEGEG